MLLRIFSLFAVAGAVVLLSHSASISRAQRIDKLSAAHRTAYPYRTQTNSQQKDGSNSWQGIVPLRSTRSDVERGLGMPTDSHGRTRIYKTSSERVDVLYSSGGCAAGEMWNVKADTVIRLVVAPNRETFIKDVDIKDYHKINESHPDNWTQYWSPDGGIVIQTITTNGPEQVLNTTYQPTTTEKVPKCPALQMGF